MNSRERVKFARKQRLKKAETKEEELKEEILPKNKEKYQIPLVYEFQRKMSGVAKHMNKPPPKIPE